MIICNFNLNQQHNSNSHAEVILSGRRINDNMGKFVAENTVKKLIRVGKAVKGARVLVLGLTFKENVGDIRNTKVVDIKGVFEPETAVKRGVRYWRL